MRMAKMIDVNAFTEHHCKDCPYRLEDSCTVEYPICSTIIDLKDFHTVEVVHSRWIKDRDGYEYCENCSRYMPVREVTGDPSENNYCPNCGAKMDGDTK